MKKQVTLQYLTLPHYRKSLFEELWANDKIDFHIVCGQESPYENLKSFQPPLNAKFTYIRNKMFSIGSRKFIWQKGIIKAIANTNPEYLILLGFDPHILSNFLLFLYAKIKRINILWWGHATYGKQGGIGKFIRSFFYKNVHGILTYDENGRQRLKTMGISVKKAFPIGNCLNNEDYPSVNVLYQEKDNRKNALVFSARLVHHKKIDLLIEALKIIVHDKKQNIMLHIVGNGPEKHNLEKLVESFNLSDNVIFHGALYGKEIQKIMLSAKLMIIPSWAGLSTIHALSYGMPVITDDNFSNHPPEVYAIISGVTGDFYKENDSVSLANKIIEWLNRDSDSMMDCLQVVQKCYTPTKVADKIISALNSI